MRRSSTERNSFRGLLISANFQFAQPQDCRTPILALRARELTSVDSIRKQESECDVGSSCQLVLLDHKFRRWFSGIRRVQHWHRCRSLQSATANRRWMVAIEFGTWRCGRIGGRRGVGTAGMADFSIAAARSGPEGGILSRSEIRNP